jgi:hypothetical protein
MYTYRVISGINGVPEMGDLHASYEEQPTPRGDVFRIVFSTGYEFNRPPYENAVGGPCRVIRTDDEGQSQEATGSVLRVGPVEVSLDGKGWS